MTSVVVLRGGRDSRMGAVYGHRGDWLHIQTPAHLAAHPDRKDTLCPRP
ncbi:hypothetical protein ACFVVU_26830 [Kitasatospora sp. NPDC057965]